MAQEFKTESVFEALRGPLALVEDAEKRQAFERYVEAARFPLERAVFDLLSGLVSAMNERVSDHYRLRLAYHTGALELDVEPLPGAERAEPDVVDLPEFLADGEMEKITIRIPAELKDLITQAAGGAGISANSWFIRVLARALGGAGLEVEHQRRARHRHRAERSAPHFYDHDAGAHGPHREPHGPGKRLQGWFGGE
jgi:hypothetical protein